MPAPVQPALAQPVDVLPEGPGWVYEPKFDGWRCIAERRFDGVELWSRRGRRLAAYFPDVAAALAAAAPGTVLDGELIVWDAGRTDFALLQRRVTAGAALARLVADHPAHYVVFDLLRADGETLLDLPLARRRDRLARLLSAAPSTLPLCPQTADPAEARYWLDTWTAAGVVEGVVAKRLDGRYLPGRRTWGKVRAWRSTEALVGGVTGNLADPHTLLLGRLDGAGRLRYVGRTHPLAPRARAELTGHLAAPPGPHPWPQPLPARWSGQLQDPQPVRYTPVAPVTAVEVEVDTAFEYGRYRHPVRYRRIRLDLAASDVAPV